jgi:hypothetical protein
MPKIPELGRLRQVEHTELLVLGETYYIQGNMAF